MRVLLRGFVLPCLLFLPGDQLERHIIASDPRVTRFPIDWGDGLLDGCPEPEQTEEPDVDEQLLMPSSETPICVVDDEEEDDEPEEDELEEEASENVPEEGNAVSGNAVPVNKRDQLGGPDQMVTGTAGCTISEPLHQVQSSAISMDSS